MEVMQERPEVATQALNALIIARNLERAADHATNIAEDVIFWVRAAMCGTRSAWRTRSKSCKISG